MKGKLLQTQTGWIIRYEDLLRLYPFNQYGMKEIHIHPEYEKFYFLDGDADGADVEFEIVTDDNGVRLAKLIRPNRSEALDFLAEQAQELGLGYDETICEYSGQPAVTEYIGDDMDSDKIEGILDKVMNEDHLLAESHWVECDGCNETDKYFWIKGFMIGLNVGRGDLKEYFKTIKNKTI
jgi:hypothetical protein